MMMTRPRGIFLPIIWAWGCAPATRMVQGNPNPSPSQCDRVNENETDSGGDSCNYYDSRPHHCGCCDTPTFASSDCCACQQSPLTGNPNYWMWVFWNWPRKARTLHLSSKGLYGTLPPDIAARWPNVTEIDLSQNQLMGSMPLDLGSLSELSRLDLHGNRLSGSMPPQLGNLSRLRHLAIWRNQLSGTIPPELGKLTSLEFMSLGNNRLTGGVPTELGNMTSLRELYLDTNELTGSLPPELSKLTNLRVLNLYRNRLSGAVPAELGDMTGLQVLSLHNNELSGAVPEELGEMTGLQLLLLHNNELSGAVPAVLGKLSNLQILALNDNKLRGPIPPELGNLTSLRQLRLQGNLLTGSIPAKLGKLSNLQFLLLNANLLGGSIPAELSELSNLQVLFLQDNELRGPIPPGIGRLTGLRELSLKANQLSGGIPAELGNLTSLRLLFLYDNPLGGSIPSQLGNLRNLEFLWLRANNLSGPLPPELGGLVSLQKFYLDDNQLTGSLPVQLGNLVSLLRLIISNNHLGGGLPPELGSLASLEQLLLANNQLSGSLPPELGHLGRLESLDLSGNRLSRGLPAELGNLATLTNLNLQGNNLSGGFPPSFSGLSRLSQLSLAGNKLLCGETEALTKLLSLTSLDLRGCCFQDFAALPAALELLDLGENLLTEVPKPWREGPPLSLKRCWLDGNRIAQWDTSSVFPWDGRTTITDWRCGWHPTGQRFPWLALESLDVSHNPLRTRVHDFLASLSHLRRLTVLRARDADLLGILPNFGGSFVPYVNSTGSSDCTGFSVNPGFTALLTLDLAGNGIAAILASPGSRMVQADLRRNNLSALDSRWWLGGFDDTLQRVDVRSNPGLQLPVLLAGNANSSCPLEGATQLVANEQAWNVGIDGKAECTTLCTMKTTRFLVDPIVNERVLCRCTTGQGVGRDCDSCPDNTFSTRSFEDGQYRHRCQPCPANSELRGKEGLCFADCSCSAHRFMVYNHTVNGSDEVQDVDVTPCDSLPPQGWCKSCGLFKTSLPGSRSESACFCNSNPSDGGWEGLLEKQGRCGCPEGFHINFADRRCVECLPEEDCADWTRSLEPPTLKPGFWALPPPPAGSDGTFGGFSRHSIWRCESARACPGGNTYGCGLNRTGTACSLCKQGHFRAPSGTCARCPRSHTEARRLLVGLLLAGTVLPLVAHWLLASESGTLELCLALRSLRTSAKQMLKFAQVLGLVSLFSVDWPPLALSIFAVFRTLSLEFVSWAGVACLNEDQQQSMASELVFRWMLFPAFAVLSCVASVLVTMCRWVLDPVWARCCPQGQVRMRQVLCFRPADVLRLLVFSFHLFFLALLKNALVPLTCSPSPNRHLTVNSWPHVVCFDTGAPSSEGLNYWSLAVPGLVQAVILVLVFPCVVRAAWKRVDPTLVPPDSMIESEQRRLWWDFVFGDFRSHQMSWALVALCKDILLSLVVVLLPGLGTAQLLLTSVISASYACRAFWTCPYTDFSNTLLEVLASAAVATLCIFSAGMGFQSEPEVPDLGEYIGGGREGNAYLQRGITLAVLQSFSLFGPLAIIFLQLLMAFPRSRRLLPSWLKPLQEKEWKDWVELFAMAMGIRDSHFTSALEQFDQIHASDFRRVVTAHHVVKRTMTEQLTVGSGDLDQQTGNGGEVEVAQLKAEIARLSAQVEALSREDQRTQSEALSGPVPSPEQAQREMPQCEAEDLPPRIKTSL